ncbi:MAG TPA: M56 family metallopeptidase, partial [Phycisphaerae bacterium]|nr:M56 family metallopeptidase [Phycisphaerae bacterium]
SGPGQAQGEAAPRDRPGTRLAWGQRWLAGVMRVRDAIGRLPPVPPLVWACGVGLIGLLAALRTGLFFRRVRSALPAPASVTDEVRAACRAIGVRRMPDVFLLEQRVSPLIWRPLLARRARLVLPTQLWSQLDKTSRRAVLFHELAHLRRRDHWVRWAELIVAAVYWWHPVVWWVRSRLHEEAELCCDAWVTWLMPRGRRAYAEALLATRQYTRRPGWAVPAVGIGMTTGRARRFARRLTMVMTESSVPRASVSGLALMLALAVAGWVATPAQSCPPKKGCAEAPPCASKTAEVAEKEAQAASTFEEYLVKKEVEAGSEEPRLVFVSGGDDGLEERLERLEAQMERLADQLDKLGQKLGAKQGRIPSLLVAPPAPKMPKMPAMPKMEKGFFEVGGPSKVAPSEPTTRKYELSGDRLKALTALMVREDVPVLVRPLDDGIEVIGDCTVQAKFAAFVGLLDATEEARVYRLSEGKLKALTELMILSDVPVKVQPGDDGLTVLGTGAVHGIFEQFVWMLEPGEKKIKKAKKTADAGTQAAQKALEQYYKAAALGQAAQMKEHDAASEAYRTALTQYQQQYQQQQHQKQQYQKQAQQQAEMLKAQEKKAKACDD